MAIKPAPYSAVCTFLQQRHTIFKFATEWGIMMILGKKNHYFTESFIFKSLLAMAEIYKLHLVYYSCCKYMQWIYNEQIYF